ncbi:hypothetical protein [Reichenbachiella sp. MALMAid0571]|uniref:hypothetical protein n=1 Tax=Reichenbachiella sp. MALMAid0571 TaxID=3143939 RepID=UPI0032DE9846
MSQASFAQIKSDIDINVNRENPQDSLSHNLKGLNTLKNNQAFRITENGSLSEEELKNKGFQYLSSNDSLKNIGMYKKIDSLKENELYQSADSLYDRTSKFYRSLQGVELSDEELKKRTNDFLSDNDSLINLVEKLTTTGEQGEVIGKKREKYNRMSASLNTIKSFDKEQAFDTLNKIKDSRKFRETLRREGIDMGIVDNRTRSIGKAKRKFDELTFTSVSNKNISNNNISNWPLTPDYYKSRLFGYYNYYSDSVQNLLDSVQFQLQPPSLDTSVMERGSKGKLDSLKALAISKAWLKMDKTKIDDGLDEVKLGQKEAFLKKPDYAELIIGISNNDSDHLTLTPSLAYEVAKDVDFGFGVEATLNIKTFSNTILGYKGLLRYKPEKSFVYFQAESISYIPSISFTSESQRKQSQGYEHSLNVGLGVLYGLGAGININSMILYRVEKARYSFNDSPIVFRLGINFN